MTSWIISIVPIEPNTDAAAKRAEAAVHAGSPPTPKPPQAPITENRPELVKSDAETPTIQKKEQPPPSDIAIGLPATPPPEELRNRKEAEARRQGEEERAQRDAARRLAEEEERRKNAEAVARESMTAEPQVHESPQPESSPAVSPQKMKLKPIYWGGAFALAIICGVGWVIAEHMAEERAKEAAARAARSAYVAAQAPICADKFKHAANAAVNLIELKKVYSWQQDDFIGKGGWANKSDYDVAQACAELLIR